jgi:tRNA (mo5U34)-methyltransferase
MYNSDLKDLLAQSKLAPLINFTQSDYLDQLKHGDFPRWRALLRQFPRVNVSSFHFGEIVKIGSSDEVNPEAIAAIKPLLQELIPWRKGPFEVCGIPIDTEWRSNLKWARLEQELSPLAGRKILDIGCGNAYYGFRMLEHLPEFIIGIDPHLAYVAQFWALKQFAPHLPLHVLPCGLEQFPAGVKGFDTAFSMGVIYHRRSPIDHLQQCKQCLVPGGELVLETLYVDGPTGYSLTPLKKYARMSNVWFVPSIGTLEQWLLRCGFQNVRVVDESTTTTDEQRKTDWMPFDSLEDAIDKSDASKTIEDLPAPKRVVIIANSPS